MRIMTVFTFLILFCFSSFAGGGDSFRFKVSVTLTDSTELTGYVYFATFGSGYNSKKESFIEFGKREFRFPIKIYKEIKTVELNGSTQYDFSVKSIEKTIQLSEISEIKLIDKKILAAGMQRLFVLTEKEYNLIDNQPITNSFFYNAKLAENCSYLLLCWSDSSDLDKIKNEIETKVKGFVDNNKNNEVYKYIKTVKKELVEKSILIIQTCGSM